MGDDEETFDHCPITERFSSNIRDNVKELIQNRDFDFIDLDLIEFLISLDTNRLMKSYESDLDKCRSNADRNLLGIKEVMIGQFTTPYTKFTNCMVNINGEYYFDESIKLSWITTKSCWNSLLPLVVQFFCYETKMVNDSMGFREQGEIYRSVHKFIMETGLYKKNRHLADVFCDMKNKFNQSQFDHANTQVDRNKQQEKRLKNPDEYNTAILFGGDQAGVRNNKLKTIFERLGKPHLYLCGLTFEKDNINYNLNDDVKENMQSHFNNFIKAKVAEFKEPNVNENTLAKISEIIHWYENIFMHLFLLLCIVLRILKY